LGKPDEAQPERRFRHDRHYGRNGFSANGVHYDVFYASIPVDAGKTVAMFTLPTVSQMQFLRCSAQAVGVQSK